MNNHRKEIKSSLNELDLRPAKGRGQNFLSDEGFARTVVQFAGIAAGDCVVEVGPGLGVLTRAILERTSALVALEVEEKLAANLRRVIPQLESDQIWCCDARTVDLGEVVRRCFPDAHKLFVLGNVPYSISTDLLFWLLEGRQHLQGACLLLQREFAERVAAEPGERAGGVITLQRALFATAELGPVISGDNFVPPAKVESRLLKLTFLPADKIPVFDHELFTEVVRAAFSHRRKTLANSFKDARILTDRTLIVRWLDSVGIDPGRRAETLTLNEFVTMSKALKDFRRD